MQPYCGKTLLWLLRVGFDVKQSVIENGIEESHTVVGPSVARRVARRDHAGGLDSRDGSGSQLRNAGNAALISVNGPYPPPPNGYQPPPIQRRYDGLSAAALFAAARGPLRPAPLHVCAAAVRARLPFATLFLPRGSLRRALHIRTAARLLSCGPATRRAITGLTSTKSSVTVTKATTRGDSDGERLSPPVSRLPLSSSAKGGRPGGTGVDGQSVWLKPP